MDLQTDKLLQEVLHLREGERVEVRQKDVGLRGSWHPGTVVASTTGRRLVEYDELLTEDGLHKLREFIPCPKRTNVGGSWKVHTLMVTPTRSPFKRRGFLRPCPPPTRESCPLTWKAGIFVDVFFQDAWWEAVLLNDVTSLDDCALVDVIFPDEGDLARVHVKDMRVSQCWDEVSGGWSVKGSTDLSRFLKRRGIGKKEVSLIADSDCRGSEVCSKSIHNKLNLNRKQWAQIGSSSVPTAKPPLHGSTGLTQLNIEMPIFDHHKQFTPSCANADGNLFETVIPTSNASLIHALPEAELEHQMQTTDCFRRSKKVLHEGQHLKTHHSGSCCDKSIETTVSGLESVNPNNIAACVQSSFYTHHKANCSVRKIGEKECNGGNVVFKRRKISTKLTNSYEKKPETSDFNSVISCFHQDLTVDDRSGSSLDKEACNSAKINTVVDNSSTVTRCCQECSSAVVLKEEQTRNISGSCDNNTLEKKCSGMPFDDRSFNRLEMGDSFVQIKPVCKTFLLALEAPVRKTKDEYEKIMAARNCVLGGAASGRHKLVNQSTEDMQVNVKRITMGDEKGANRDEAEPVTSPKTLAAERAVICSYTSNIDPGESLAVEESPGGGTILETPSLVGRKVKGASARKIRKKEQIVQSVKAKNECILSQRSVRIRKQVVQTLNLAGTSKFSSRNDTLRSFKDLLVRQKQEKALKRKASEFDSVSDACSKEVMLKGMPETVKSGVDLQEPTQSATLHRPYCRDLVAVKIEDQTTSSLPIRGDSTAKNRKTHKRIRVIVASNTSEQSSAACLDIGKRNYILKKKANEARFMPERDCRNKRKLLGASKPETKPNTLKGSYMAKRRVPQSNFLGESCDRGVKFLRMSRSEGDQDDARKASTFIQPKLKVKKQKKSDGKTLKILAREIGIKAILEAGFTIEYRLRRNESSSDAVYTSPQGSSYWSLPNAWHALGNDKKKGRIRVEKAVMQEVFSKIEQDEKYSQTFGKLDKFSGTRIDQVVRQANMTYADLTDVLLEDLGVLRKPFSKQTKESLKTLRLGILLVKKRGRKPKQMIESGSRKTDQTLPTSKGFSVQKHLQGSSLSNFERKRSVLMESTSRKLNKSYTFRYSRKAKLKAGTMVIGSSKEKWKNNLKRFSRNHRNEKADSKLKSLKQKDKDLKPRSGLRLEVRPSSSCATDVSEDLLCQNKRTVLSWMIGRGAVSETERVCCVDQVSNKVMKEGVVAREGILCRCCQSIFTLKGFTDHGEFRGEVQNCKLVFSSGKTLLDCQNKAWNQEIILRMTQNYMGVSVNDTNDDTCLLCGDGGVLLCCDFCPSTFHSSCLQLDNVPEGNWYCPNCCCRECKGRPCIEEQTECSQCEHKYHYACLQRGHTMYRGQLLCRNSCQKIYSALKNLIGISHSLGKGFSWTLLHCTEEPQCMDVEEVMQNNSKLAVALLVLKECFNPMEDPRTNIDMITHAAYNRRSQFWRLNYVGFYTVVLERDDEIISVASIRIHGAKLAEMPLIGTRHKYRRQGMCRLLVGAIERLLSSLEVGTFVLPAIPELYETWTQAFGFKPLDSSLRSDIKDLSMMVFPGTDLLQKSLLGGNGVSSPTFLSHS